MAGVTADNEVREEIMNWSPAVPLKEPPLFVWPPRPIALVKWLFGYPGYFLPHNIFYMGLALLTWFYLTPDMATMKTFQFDWIAWIYGRNLAMMFLVFGGWHLRFYVTKPQGTAYKFNKNWPEPKHQRFLFGDQVWDNMFWTIVCGGAIWTTYEVLTLWAFANEFIPYLQWESSPVWFVILFLAIPFIRDVHFYLVHRLLHVKPVYRSVHYIHHKNVNIGPWTGLAMHPVELLLQFSSVLIHLVVMSHPLHVIFNLQHAGLTPSLGHAGFEKCLVGGSRLPISRHFHYLHHKYFECNYGGDTVFMDKWFGSFHDGTPAADALMKERRKRAHARA